MGLPSTTLLVLFLLTSPLYCLGTYCYAEVVTCSNNAGSGFSASDISTLQSILQGSSTVGSAWSSIGNYYGGHWTVFFEPAGTSWVWYSEWHKAAVCSCAGGTYTVIQQ
jgi:hypothetical protein